MQLGFVHIVGADLSETDFTVEFPGNILTKITEYHMFLPSANKK